jgi:hexosaminidase
MKNLTALTLILFIFSCKNSNQQSFSVSDLKITWSVVENLEGAYANSWKISNEGTGILPATGWSIYYNHVVGVPIVGSSIGSLDVTQISGTFYSLAPNEAFKPLGKGESTRLDLQCSGFGLKFTDAPSGLYLIIDGESPKLIENFEVGPFPPAPLMKRGATDNVPVPTTELRYHQNDYLTMVPQDQDPVVIPTPRSKISANGVFTLPKELVIGYQPGLEDEAQLLKQRLQITGLTVNVVNNPEEGHVRLSIGSFSQGNRENYRLIIDQDQVSIQGADPAGVFYGTQSLVSLWPLDAWNHGAKGLSINCQTIVDGPRFSYRGLYLDVARNFQKPEAIKQVLDMMSFYKLNRLLFGISNDEGWRLEIKGIPELTDIGSVRGHTENELDHLFPAYGSGPFPNAENNHGAGHYTREDFIDILKYAQERHIEVIPEINFPGHARAAVKSMEARTLRITQSESDDPTFRLHDPNDQSEYNSVQGYDDNVICPCQESVYQFLETVIADLVTIYQDADVNFTTVHTGGDEVPAGIWQKSPLCIEFLQENPHIEGVDGLPGYFLQRYYQILEQHQLITAGWEEIAMHKVAVADDADDIQHLLVPNPSLTHQNLLPFVWNSAWGTADDLAYKLANKCKQLLF